jgi:uncharacterized membrane protein
MPLDVKKAIFSLILSFVAMLLADYLNSLYLEGYTFFNLVILGVNLAWAVVVAWIISGIFKKKNVIPSLYAASAVMLYFLVTDFTETGFTPSQIFSLLEIVFFLIPVYFLKTANTKLWVEEKNS